MKGVDPHCVRQRHPGVVAEVACVEDRLTFPTKEEHSGPWAMVCVKYSDGGAVPDVVCCRGVDGKGDDPLGVHAQVSHDEVCSHRRAVEVLVLPRLTDTPVVVCVEVRQEVLWHAAACRGVL